MLLKLSQELLNSIKAAFNDKFIEISLTEAMEDRFHLLSSETNKSDLQQSEHSLQQGK
jgi:hypothetical protein